MLSAAPRGRTPGGQTGANQDASPVQQRRVNDTRQDGRCQGDCLSPGRAGLGKEWGSGSFCGRVAPLRPRHRASVLALELERKEEAPPTRNITREPSPGSPHRDAVKCGRRSNGSEGKSGRGLRPAAGGGCGAGGDLNSRPCWLDARTRASPAGQAALLHPW